MAIKKINVFDVSFNRSFIDKYKLNANEIFILGWFASFLKSKRMEKIKVEGKEYYWVHYKKIADDLSISRLSNPISIEHVIFNMIGEKPILEKTLKSSSKRINRVYLRFTDLAFKEAFGRGGKMKEGLFEETIVKDSKVNKKKSRKLNGSILKIANELVGDREIFKNTMPTDDFHYTKALSNFQSKIQSILEGRFSIEYKLSDEFVKRNRSHDIEKSKKLLKECYNDPSKLVVLLKKAKRNYLTWFDPKNEPMSKCWLPKDISTWLYNERNGSSVFLACLDGSAYPAKEYVAERSFNIIPKEYRNEVMLMCSPDMNSGSIFSRFNSIIEWYHENIPKAIQKDSNISYWAGSEKAFIGLYLQYIRKLTNNYQTLYATNLGIDNPTWYSFLRAECSEHDCDYRNLAIYGNRKAKLG